MKEDSQNKNRSKLTVVGSSSPKAPSIPQLSSLMEAISQYKVLVIGDGIYDEYIYVQPQGKSPKENLISNKVLRAESFRGGVWAAAKHINSFCNAQVAVGSTITKSRYVEDGYLRKLFEVHEDLSVQMVPEYEFKSFDLVVVADFGHGAITQELIDKLQTAPYLAVNAQTNSANIGFNLITKYTRADYVVLDEQEARLAAHDRDSDIEKIIVKLWSQLGLPKFVVTQGPRGAIPEQEQTHC